MLVRYFLYLLSSRKKVEFQSRIDGLKQYMELRSVENKLQGFCLTKSGSFLIQLSQSGAKKYSSKNEFETKFGFWIKKEFPCSKFWLSPMRLKELNSKFSKTTGLETEADFRVWGHYIFVKAGIRSCNPLVRLSLGCKEGTRRNGRFGLPSRQAPSGNRHQCPFR